MNNMLILMGDSLTFGYGVSKKNSWVYKLSEKLPMKILNKGINGDTTTSMLNRFYEDVSVFNTRYLFIMGGTNDLLSGRFVISIIDNINEMIKDSTGKKIIIGIPPCIIKSKAESLFMPSDLYTYCEDSLPILRKELINLCNNHSIQYVDFYLLTSNNIDKGIFIDGIHLNSLGNNLMLTEFLKVFTL